MEMNRRDEAFEKLLKQISNGCERYKKTDDGLPFIALKDQTNEFKKEFKIRKNPKLEKYNERVENLSSDKTVIFLQMIIEQFLKDKEFTEKHMYEILDTILEEVEKLEDE